MPELEGNYLNQRGRLKERLRRGETVYGTFWGSPDAGLLEAAALGGLDFVILDREHGPLGLESIQHLARAAAACRVAVLVRASGLAWEPLHVLLDSGVEGLLIPHVVRAEQAREVVEQTKFAPEGSRGVHPYVRAAGYGLQPAAQYLARENQRTFLAVQVEGAEGVENLEEIARVPGLDAIFVGPYDLSQSLGIPGQLDHPRLLEAMDACIRTIRSAGLAAAVYADSPEQARRWRQRGVQFLAILADGVVMHRAYAQLMRDARQE